MGTSEELSKECNQKPEAAENKPLLNVNIDLCSMLKKYEIEKHGSN